MSREKLLDSILFCSNCNKEIIVKAKEYNRQTKKGRKHFFCSLSCSAHYNNINATEEVKEMRRNFFKNLSPEAKEKQKQNLIKFVRKHDPNFYHYLRQVSNKRFCNKNVKFQTTDIDEKYLKDLWEQQEGFCALSHIPIIPRYQNRKKSLSVASLDRIDSSIGYMKGNVQFVALGINYAKNGYTNEEMLEFINQIRLV